MEAAAGQLAPRRRRRRVPYLLVLPVVAVMCAILAYPIYDLFRLSLQQYGLFELIQQKGTYIGLDNFRSVLQDDVFWNVLRRTVVKFDNLWRIPSPYVMPLHQAPTDGGDYRGFHFHIEFHPPLRRPNLLKYLAGPEIGGGNFLSDTSPEEKAAELRAASEVHYKREARGEV